MEIKKCPACGETNTFDAGMRTKLKITSWIVHIKARARVEAFDKLFFKDEYVKTPHFDWLVKNAVVIPNNKIIIKNKS